jgi:hypothetical protein
MVTSRCYIPYFDLFTGHSATVYCIWQASAVVTQMLSALLLWAWSGVLLFLDFELLPPTSPFSGVCYRAFVSRYSFIVNGWTGELYGLGWV